MPSHHTTDDVSGLLFAPSVVGLEFPIPAVGPVTVSRTGVVHRRGLVATRDISPGECLFIVNPTASASVVEVRSRWEKSDGDRSLESLAEDVLLEDMRRCLESDEASAASFMTLFGEDGSENEKLEASENGKLLIDLLLGKGKPEGTFDGTNKAELLGIVRRNAFGPDFRNYSAIEGEWSSQEKEPGKRPLAFNRVLGMYPLPAIINHSCEPNAVRIFAGETMIAHASSSIQKGQEIVWSYIPPTQTYHQRQKQISSKYGFRCACTRCQNEGSALGSIDGLIEQLASMDELNFPNLSVKGIPKLEEILQDKRLSNESRRYFRIGYTNLFMNDFNLTLLDLARQTATSDANAVRDKVLAQATQLHFSFAACHNASTEHLSILHLCYELISFIHASSDNQSKTIIKVRFWTEQLKRAHVVRYGCLGNDLENIRRVMKHTRLVLRNRDGLQKAEWNFL